MGATLGVVMGIPMSFFLTYLNLGFVENFLQKWMIAYLGTLPVGFIISLLVTPLVKAFVDRVSE